MKQHAEDKKKNFYIKNNSVYQKKEDGNITSIKLFADKRIITGRQAKLFQFYWVPVVKDFAINKNNVVLLEKCSAVNSNSANATSCYYIANCGDKIKKMNQNQCIELGEQDNRQRILAVPFWTSRLPHYVEAFNPTGDGKLLVSFEGNDDKNLQIIVREKFTNNNDAEWPIIWRHAHQDTRKTEAIELFKEFRRIALLKDDGNVLLIKVPDEVGLEEIESAINFYGRKRGIFQRIENSR